MSQQPLRQYLTEVAMSQLLQAIQVLLHDKTGLDGVLEGNAYLGKRSLRPSMSREPNLDGRSKRRRLLGAQSSTQDT